MGKGRPRSVEKGVLGQSSGVLASVSLDVPTGPVFYPNEEEFEDPLEYIAKIRPEAEPFGICRIVPPKNWNPPFALDLDSFTFSTKTQAIHQLQARPPSCDSKTFELEYDRFLEDHCGKKGKKKVIFDGKELNLCKLFNGVKRYGGYEKVVNDKKWAEVYRFVRSGKKITECSKHVLCQLYREHLCDYESYFNQLNRGTVIKCKRDPKSEDGIECSASKRRRKNYAGEKIEVRKVEEEEKHDQICEQCRSGLHGEVMLLCDRCNKGWHIYCLSPPLKQVPHGNWYCIECLNSDKDSFGFVPGKHFSMEAFRRMADRAKKKWFSGSSPSRVDIEKKFWEIVEGSVGEVEVRYGSDLDTSVYGSGFPRIDDQKPESVQTDIWDTYCSSPWNLNNLPKLKGSMLQAVHDNIAGVMVPWLYIGMLFSSFCWHFEDHCFYSMNYLHWGEPKLWYSVPGSAADAFEKVMRDTLPDLFDAQPDLLFQLVTMLNPSVLQENGVPVYSVLQEPGNFVITFPRSFHGGFNMGLNCAEAVNFAPADWLPHGGIGASLYQLYRKAAVLSHEELLCVIAKVVGPLAVDLAFRNKLHYSMKLQLCFLQGRQIIVIKKELLRTYTKEKNWRERIWRAGVVYSSPMSPRKHPEYVGTEEDPTCVICQQYLYLSALVCRCRPSAFVCLEHWEHLCECKRRKRRLLYRHTLAELNALVLITDESNNEETSQSRKLRPVLPSFDGSSAVRKKVKGGHVTFSQRAEEWLLHSCKIFQNPYSSEAYTKALKDAEQFLWAGSEMDPVRDVVKNLIEAHSWAERIEASLSLVKDWSHDSNVEKVCLDDINNLLDRNPVPCNEPGYATLKMFADQTKDLSLEAASMGSSVYMSELEELYSRCHDLPICSKEIENLGKNISLAKAWIDSVRNLISKECSVTVEVDALQNLKFQMLELQVQVPESKMFLELLSQAESCKVDCDETLKSTTCLKNVEMVLQKYEHLTISIPELELLRQHHCDAVSWISRVKKLLDNMSERAEQENVVLELGCIMKEGESLRIKVDELPLVEMELKKACCREKALMASRSKLSLDFVQQIVMEAEELQMEREKIFVDIAGVLAASMRWEERAKHILATESQMSEYEDALRTAEEIPVVLPSLDEVKDSLSTAKSWLKSSEPFLASARNVASDSSSSLLKVKTLKTLVSQSKLVKISMEERTVLQEVLKNCLNWECEACSLMKEAVCLFNTNAVNSGDTHALTVKIEGVVTLMESVVSAGLSLGFGFNESVKLQNACSSLQWCNKALSLCSVAPPFEEAEKLLKAADHVPLLWTNSDLFCLLVDGVGWLGRAAKVTPLEGNHSQGNLNDIEKVLSDFQSIRVPCPVMVNQLTNGIQKHKSWLEKVNLFLSLSLVERSWSQLVCLKELGISDAFKCAELDRVQIEIEKVEKWMQHCRDIIRPTTGDLQPVSKALLKIKQTLDISMLIYDSQESFNMRNLCRWCCSELEDQALSNCSICCECYHSRCMEPVQDDESVELRHVCPHCSFVESGSISWIEDSHLRSKGKRPELITLAALLTESEDFIVRVEERDILEEVVKKALACKVSLRELVDHILGFCDKDLNNVSKKLTTALKAVKAAGVFDDFSNSYLEKALVKNAWRVRSNELLEGSQKPSIQLLQVHLKEGVTLGIPPEDYYLKEVRKLKRIGLQWADTAKKVAADSGALELDKVIELILEGEALPVHFEKELKLLNTRSMLYCICRKPYDQRAMIACDLCDEWYHFDCINLSTSPKTYICPACDPEGKELHSSFTLYQERSKIGEPQTPSPRHTEARKTKRHKHITSKRKILEITEIIDILKQSNGGIGRLLWKNKKPYRRASKKRTELKRLSDIFQQI